ncbi:MAG: DUF262 domain-containing HNH endonuclease family protein [Chloroflexota bacterium]
MDNNLEKFFTGKLFRIPFYQRDYAWNTGNIDDLFEDILEAIETKTNHYIGTFILSAGNEKPWFNVVDGQQRLTTLMMLFNAVIQKLDSEKEKIINLDKFVCTESGIESTPIWKLELLNDNNQFFKSMLSGEDTIPRTRSQQMLKMAYKHIETRVKELPDQRLFLDAMRNLEVMEFAENNDGKAIRMFQTVNDRGQPLTNMEKAKSLLIYYSNRFLSGKLDEYINTSFGDIFHDYTEIKTIGEECQISVISSNKFSEDSIMRYHYLAYADDLYDYDASENYVLDTYLKKTLKPLRTQEAELRKIIENYVNDLKKYYNSTVMVMRKVKTDPKYYKLFSILGLSATLYPLIIRLETRGLLESPLIQMKDKQFLDLIEVTDFRVYKMRGTNPRADMSALARDAKKLSSKDIENKIRYFVQRFMGDDEFERHLKTTYHNTPTVHMIIEFGEEVINQRAYNLSELQHFKKTQPTVEHIFPQQERFSFPNLEFDNVDEYKHLIQTIGNLTVLEKTLNSQCQNKIPDQKISGGFYEKSSYEDAKRISAQVKNLGLPFTRNDIEKRTNQFVEFIKLRWKV